MDWKELYAQSELVNYIAINSVQLLVYGVQLRLQLFIPPIDLEV